VLTECAFLHINEFLPSVEPGVLLRYSQNPAIGSHQVVSYFQVSLVKFLRAFLISPTCGLSAFWLILVSVMFSGKYILWSNSVPPRLIACHFDPRVLKYPVLRVSLVQCDHRRNPCAGAGSQTVCIAFLFVRTRQLQHCFPSLSVR
jgi:hypothetical protein